ncbi:MAG: RNA polymerase sigma factor RpoD/SigA [Candidatus Latescibacteria bacterium]|jgi:RNA polymerase primary sigma factor|nr:RNA polymerase sigma factor RpoD/SigA [Candidatus Latescibacterota bacterium]
MTSVSAERRAPAGERSLACYYREVERYPRITLQEERALAARAELGDRRALEGLVNANLRFVIHVAKGFRNQGLSMADLINEGNLGLLTAARKYRLNKGCKFITYAVWWIRQNILKALEVQTRDIRIPANVVNDLSRLRKLEAGLAQSLQREPTLEEVSTEAELEAEKAAVAFRSAPNTISLDSTLYEDESGPLCETIPDLDAAPPDEALFEKLRREEVGQALDTLPQRHQEILTLIFGMNGVEPATYQDIGGRLGISRERVRQLKEDALRKLRQSGARKRLAAYCD